MHLITEDLQVLGLEAGMVIAVEFKVRMVPALHRARKEPVQQGVTATVVVVDRLGPEVVMMVQEVQSLEMAAAAAAAQF
ncbi:MAG: hypothetical protein K2Q26_08205 [Bdellovibrionales bacterium]|nr:hypothetical protein [Bdellovibrionales bacterium]